MPGAGSATSVQTPERALERRAGPRTRGGSRPRGIRTLGGSGDGSTVDDTVLSGTNTMAAFAMDVPESAPQPASPAIFVPSPAA
ncbi:hypothetical protein EVAR_7350_1 [Eumeta japonica]|uniref:Uncharacterized protein n=1 Tax=Eumeta variegata TaxID=151549 RepID=A0A4C1T2R2_EUMVA|nr:hypothetical protein EVAR_7350_1 [Eumeta japonica]